MRWDLPVLLAVQRHTGGPTSLVAASALSRAGEHAAAWIILGVVGASVDRSRHRAWVDATTTVVAAHAASVVVKRVVRRVRPEHVSLVQHVAVPSRWSFPSSHAASTTAAAYAYGPLLGTWATAMLPPAMAWSRLVLGVHFPTDVLSGTALGAGVAALAPSRRRARR